MSVIRLLIVDPDDRYWKAAEADMAADPRFGQVLRVRSHEQALLACHSVQPTVAVVNLTVPSPGATELLRRLVEGTPPAGVVAICESLDDGELSYAVGAGASAAMARTAPLRQMIGSILEVAAGRLPIQRDLSERPLLLSRLIVELQRRLRGGQPSSDSCPLTNRELSILDMVADGHANKEIAAALDISERTVKNHMTNILAKLTARDRAHAVRIGIEHAWICQDRWQLGGALGMAA